MQIPFIVIRYWRLFMARKIVEFSELKSRIRSLEGRIVGEMCQVNYMTRFLSKLRECERVVDQLEREIIPLMEVKSPDPVVRRRRRKVAEVVDE